MQLGKRLWLLLVPNHNFAVNLEPHPRSCQNVNRLRRQQLFTEDFRRWGELIPVVQNKENLFFRQVRRQFD